MKFKSGLRTKLCWVVHWKLVLLAITSPVSATYICYSMLRRHSDRNKETLYHFIKEFIYIQYMYIHIIWIYGTILIDSTVLSSQFVFWPLAIYSNCATIIARVLSLYGTIKVVTQWHNGISWKCGIWKIFIYYSDFLISVNTHQIWT